MSELSIELNWHRSEADLNPGKYSNAHSVRYNDIHELTADAAPDPQPLRTRRREPAPPADRLRAGDVELVVGEEQVGQCPVAVGAAREARPRRFVDVVAHGDRGRLRLGGGDDVEQCHGVVSLR